LIAIALLALAWFENSTGFVKVTGDIAVTREIRLPEGAKDLILDARGARLQASVGFQGRALLVCSRCQNVRILGLTIQGPPYSVAERPASDLPPYDRTFASYANNNGILIEQSDQVVLDGVRIERIPGFAVLVTRSTRVIVDGAQIFDSGSLKPSAAPSEARGQAAAKPLGGSRGKGTNADQPPPRRNNTTGGILFEDGSKAFTVQYSSFRNVVGNAVWTHSRFTAPRNEDGWIHHNQFEEIGRDAIQVGHAIRVRVEQNTGRRIGYPLEAVDIEGGGTPVAIDTAGNVEASSYSFNRFEEINGKCIDLDGFHDGEVHGNVCRNAGKASDYPFGHFAIVMNNTNPQMQSERIRITNNSIDGTKFGGIFVIGSGHLLSGNWLRRLNLAGCPDTHVQFGCLSFAGEPEILHSGIYFGKGAERPAPAKGNTAVNNFIEGAKLKCFAAAPTVALQDQKIAFNQCLIAPE
jgi:hypothetical protein